MQYVWQHRLWTQAEMRTVDGRAVQVIDPGRLNTDAGPDFFNAKIAIGGRTWVGNVEIHVRASDWFRHRHDADRAYDSVILHVVDRDDAVVRRPSGEPVPQLCMPCTPDFHQKYHRLVDSAESDLPCRCHIAEMPRLYLTDWLGALAYERLHSKVDRVYALLDRYSGDWEETCYNVVARCLGFGINGEPFERLAASLPLMFIGKHSDSLTSIEALLFGQSGLLDDAPAADAYVARLQREYEFLSHKFGLRRPGHLGWKMSRMRPGNFPHRRIAILAAMLYGGFRMMSRLLAVSSDEDAFTLFSPQVTGYWAHHYNFGTPQGKELGGMSRSSLSVMTVNAVVPLMYAYGTSHGDTALADRSVDLLHSLAPERNSIVDLFASAGIKCRDAFDTQAVIELRREYCEKRKCLYCRIGHRMLSASRRPAQP